MSTLRIDGNENVTARPDKTAGTEYTYTVSDPTGTETWTATARYDGKDAAIEAVRAATARRGESLFLPMNVYRTKTAKDGTTTRGRRLRWTRFEILKQMQGIGFVFIHPAGIPASDAVEAVRDALPRK